MAHILGRILFVTMGLLVSAAIIGVLVFLTRKNLIAGKNKTFLWIIGLLQATHIALFFTNILAIIIQADVYVGFIVCVILSLSCLLLSVWLVLPFAKCKNIIKYLFLFFAVIQVFTVFVMFLIGDKPAGFPPLIQF